MATMGPSVWDPSKSPSSSSLKNTPDATPESSLRGGSLYSNNKKQKHVSLSEALHKISVNSAPTSPKSLLPKQHFATEIDPRDKGTPDDWIPRHPSMVRLTGRHPYNVEPPLSMLLDQGFITPVSLHYVRTHGSTPRIGWDEHKLTIKGLVKKPLTLSMDELVNLVPSVTLPITLVCAGNRRKEENMIKKTIGFSWGAAGHACNQWTGIKLCDLLEYCGVDKSKAKHVCFVGAKTEGLPNGDGTYGTSIPISNAMDAYGDVLIAWEQNGVRLHPDHGFPLRVVIPGWIGGRMVKWLEEIEVTADTSHNFYHFFDNRILPPHVDAELAKAEGWWYKPEYLFNELNINSAIVYPENNEIMKLTGAGQYTFKGYAYSGGGRKVTRVEISFDGGKSWSLCECSYPEEEASYAPSNGKYWCWMFWEYTVDKFQIFNVATNSGEIRCRAWDCASNTQPRDITWNLMGMGNNCNFTIKVHPEQDQGMFALRFEHPTVPGPAKGGWMKPPVTQDAASEVNAPLSKRAASSPALARSTKKYTMSEVEQHGNKDSAWIVVNGSVYDCTRYLDEHPGGATSILLEAGGDCTEEFMGIHSIKAQRMLEDYYIGELIEEQAKPKLNITKSSANLLIADLPSQDMRTLEKIEDDAESELVALHPKKWIDFELVKIVSISSDTRLFTFALQSPEHRLGLPVGYHMFIKAKINGTIVMRAYTPVSLDDQLGTFTLCIKVYFPNVHPKFPDGGKMSQYMESMKVGDTLQVKGPLGHFEYKGYGKYILKDKEKTAKKFGFICGGTGLTPAYQVLQSVLKNLDDKTEIYLLYANKCVEDILMYEELKNMAAKRDNIHIWYTLDNPPEEGWEFSKGFVSEGMLKDHFVAPDGDNVCIGMCGPKPMIDFACVPNLEKLGFEKGQYFEF